MAGQRKKSPKGPRWTIGRLRFVLILTFGLNSRGGPNTRAAAETLGVSQRTVQRWLRGPYRSLPHIAPARLEQLRKVSRPDEETVEQEQQSARYARDAIERIALPKKRGVLASWRDRQWLEPHIVAVLDLRTLGLRQVAVSRVSDKSLPGLRRRGAMIDSTTVPTRFHATVLAHELLQILDQWRLQIPPGLITQGRTQTWTIDAPQVDLDALAVTHGLR